MEINVDDINIDELKLGAYGFTMSYVLKGDLFNEVSDEVFSWILNPPPIYNAIGDEIKEHAKQRAKEYSEKRSESLKITRLLKKEFYDFLCTESEYYKKERSSIGGSINALITGLAATIATKLGNVEIGIVTSFVTCFIIVLGKIGKKAMCEYCKPKE